jgi:hypothetical protein
MGIFDTLFGISDARVDAAKMNTAAGSRAIRQQSRNLSGQLGAQQYSLAASARGSSGPLALREAQRRSQMGQQQIGSAALSQQSQLEQQAAQANLQAQMQANSQNAQIEMQNDQAFSRGLGGLISTGATAAMFMSDVRAKENVRPMYSDFVMKESVPGLEDPIVQRPAPARAIPVAYRGPMDESRAAFGLNVDRRPTTTLEQGAIERRVIEDIQRPELRSAPAQYRPQMMRPGVQPEQLSDPAIARHLRDRREAADLEAQTAREQADPQYNPLLLSLREYGRGMMSDKRAKNVAFQQGMRAGMQKSPMTPGYTHVPPPGYGAMPSDFRTKEPMGADESREALAPVRPVTYQYKEGPSARMAAETGATPEERAMVFQDKRSPRDGILAQDLQQSPAFAPSVMDTPAGLAVDRDRALSTNLAATAGQAKVNAEQDQEIHDLRRMLARYLGRDAA